MRFGGTHPHLKYILCLFFFCWSAFAFLGFRRPSLPKARDLIYPSLGFLAGFILYIIQFARMARNSPPTETMGHVVGMTLLSRLGTLSPARTGKARRHIEC